MNKQEQIESLLDRFMAAETTEQEERQLAEYFRAATDIPSEWQPYADMFQILDEGATRLTDSELEECATTQMPHRKTWRVSRVAAVLALILCLGAVAATITYRAFVEQSKEPSTSSKISTISSLSTESRGTETGEGLLLPDTIVFNNLPLADIAKQITSIYGSKVVFADPETASLRLYFTLPKGSTVEDFVAIIDDYETLAAAIKDDIITIKKQEEKR